MDTIRAETKGTKSAFARDNKSPGRIDISQSKIGVDAGNAEKFEHIDRASDIGIHNDVETGVGRSI